MVLAEQTEDTTMAPSSRQKRITGRVMHEFKHGELKSGAAASFLVLMAFWYALPLIIRRLSYGRKP
jgi:hypothetical protein